MQFNHPQSTVAGVDAKEVQDWAPHLHLLRYLLPSKSTDTALQASLCNDTWAFLPSHCKDSQELSFFSHGLAWYGGKKYTGSLIKSRKIRQVKFWVLDEQIKLCSTSHIVVWESKLSFTSTKTSLTFNLIWIADVGVLVLEEKGKASFGT